MVNPVYLIAAFCAAFIPLMLLGFFAGRQRIVPAIFSAALISMTSVPMHKVFGQANAWEIAAYLVGGLPGVAAGIGMARYSMSKPSPTKPVMQARVMTQRRPRRVTV